MPDPSIFPLSGGCTCGSVRYLLTIPPLTVNCCHCRWCQRETGASFALNAIVEANHVTHTATEPVLITIPSVSGAGQILARCPTCYVVVWSNYSFHGPLTRIVKVGTLDKPELLPLDAHIFVESKQPWVNLEGQKAFEGYYDVDKVWRKSSLERLEKLKPEIERWKEESGGKLDGL